jgi:hypothetical protein
MLGTAPSDEDLLAMRRAAWRTQGVVVLRPEDVRDAWTRQALINEANRLYGGRPGRRAMSRRIKPHKERGRELEEVREKDTLGKMLRAGTIDQAMHDAAKDFQAAFILAQLDPLRALPVLRVPGTGHEPELNERQLHARRRVQQAMAALGGISSPAGSCVWHVVGLQRSVREWGPAPGLGRPAGAAGAGSRYFSGSTRDAGHAFKVWDIKLPS